MNSMKQRLVIYQGLPGSGKTYDALQCVKYGQGRYKRVNRDDLRGMIDAGEHSPGNEAHIKGVELAIAERFLLAGYSVIVDDTNLAVSAMAMWRELSGRMGIEIEIRDFTDVDVDLCVQRDREREKPVGERIIRKMHEQYIRNRR